MFDVYCMSDFGGTVSKLVCRCVYKNLDFTPFVAQGCCFKIMKLFMVLDKTLKQCK